MQQGFQPLALKTAAVLLFGLPRHLARSINFHISFETSAPFLTFIAYIKIGGTHYEIP
jgi:hypothetical protein